MGTNVYAHKAGKEIHLGKRSGGWKFSLNHNNWQYYKPNVKSIMDFVRSCDYIKDEYGDEVTPDGFRTAFLEWDPEGWDHRSYALYELLEDKAKYGYVRSNTMWHFNFCRSHGFHQRLTGPDGESLDDMPFQVIDNTDFS